MLGLKNTSKGGKDYGYQKVNVGYLGHICDLRLGSWVCH